MSTDFISKLRKINNAIKDRYDPHELVIRSSSPSTNFVFGNGYGLPAGYSIALWGPPKGGKTFLANSMIGQMHKDIPDGYAIKYDVEFRDRGQLTSQKFKGFGIDEDRYVAFEGNKPEDVFDNMEKEIVPLCEQGMNLKLVVVDSFSMLQGRREAEQGSVNQHQIGDHAQTLIVGLKKMLPIQRKYRFGLIAICQARSELDRIEVMRGKDKKMQASWGIKHHCEYFMMVEQNLTKAGKTNESGDTFEDDTRKDLRDKSEITGHKVRVWMQDSSMGPKGRSGEFTIDYEKGIVNTHEEVFRLGLNWGVIEKQNARTYTFDGHTWTSKKDALDAMVDVGMQGKVLKKLHELDKAGRICTTAAPELVEE